MSSEGSMGSCTKRATSVGGGVAGRGCGSRGEGIGADGSSPLNIAVYDSFIVFSCAIDVNKRLDDAVRNAWRGFTRAALSLRIDNMTVAGQGSTKFSVGRSQ